MGIFSDYFVQSLKYRNVMCRLSRSNHYKLKMICEAINENVDVEYQVTPEMIGTRVLETFIHDAFQDSTNRIVKRVIPEVRKPRNRAQR